MIGDKVISNCIEEAGSISNVGLCVTDVKGAVIAATSSFVLPDKKVIDDFTAGAEDSCEISGKFFVRIKDDGEDTYILISDADDKGNISARLVAAQLRNLVKAYADKVDRNSFLQNLLLENLLVVDIYNRAKKLHIDAETDRCVFVIEPVSKKDNSLIETVRELFYTEAGDYVTAVDEDHIVVIKTVDEENIAEDLEETARMLVDVANSEAGSDVRVAYGTVAADIKGVPRSYREAKMALDVSRIFYPQKRTIDYANLGVGRLIYQLPVNLCRLFVREIFGDNIPDEIDEEILTTVNRFFENSLNVSETSRQLFIHRNTLIYRIEKLQKATGLDVRVFDDALTLKIALMVVNYMKYAESETT